MDRQSKIELAKNYLDDKDFYGFVEVITDVAELPSTLLMSPDELLLILTGIEGYIQQTVTELRITNIIFDEDSNDANIINHIVLLNQELRTKCDRCEILLTKFTLLTQQSITTTATLKLMKLRADIGFYACQIAEIGDSNIFQQTEELYQSALNIASQLQPSMTGISAAVNFSVFLMEIKKDTEAAVENVVNALSCLSGYEECAAGRQVLHFLLDLWIGLLADTESE